ncbi:MAG: TIGR02679 family protein [Planctomycetes bacterium]|nr:TIGR02679 family protein [Planctomycetota bacterium]
MATAKLDVPRLQTLFANEHLGWLLERLRQRLENGQPLRGSIKLNAATLAQRDAIDRLLGRPPSRGRSLVVGLDQLEATLRQAELCANLAEGVEAVLGPVKNLRAVRAEADERWRQLWSDARQRGSCTEQHDRWLTDLQTSGLLRRLSRNNIESARMLLEQAGRVIEALPACGVPLAEFSAVLLGDSHALDHGSPVGTLVMRAIADQAGMRDEIDAEARRDAWASVGVLLDELSFPVLTLNLKGDPESLTGRSLNLHAAAGEPCRLTVRQLLRHPPQLDAAAVGRSVYVCENPTIVAAVANRLGARSAPLVCIDGYPRTASRVLLNRLAASGVQLHYHGDFDWSGIQIANLVISRHGAKAWRFDSTSYQSYDGGLLLEGSPVVASWDALLMPAMLDSGRAIHEEQVLQDLLVDLGR